MTPWARVYDSRNSGMQDNQVNADKHNEESTDMAKWHDTRHIHGSKRENRKNVVRTRYGWIIPRLNRLAL